MSRLAHLSQRIFNTPLMIHPRKAEVIIASLSDRLGITHAYRMMECDDQFLAQQYDGSSDDVHSYELLEGVAVIPVHGTLVQRSGYLSAYSGMTGYDGIRQNFLVALEDPAVRAIVLDIDSPGGEVSGCFDLVDTIYEARGRKPIRAILTENAYSAAYAIASAADRISVPRTGGTGSIGVVWMHVDWSKALDKAGLAVTFITYGARKAEGNPYQPLGDASERIQETIDEVGELFVGTVSRNRRLSADLVRGTEAGVFQGAAGVSLGLADAVESPDAAFLALLDELG